MPLQKRSEKNGAVGAASSAQQVYERLNKLLGCCREQWVALAEPQEVFHFDFHEAERNMQPASNMLEFKFTQVRHKTWPCSAVHCSALHCTARHGMACV